MSIVHAGIETSKDLNLLSMVNIFGFANVGISFGIVDVGISFGIVRSGFGWKAWKIA